MKFVLVINVKMPTNVGILTFITRTRDIYCCSELEITSFICILIVMKIVKFMLKCIEHTKSLTVPRLFRAEELKVTLIFYLFTAGKETA